MRELIFIENSTSEFKGKKYTISQFIDCYNYKVLYATDLPNCDDLLKGHKYLCDFDVTYDTKKNAFKFKIVNALKVDEE